MILESFAAYYMRSRVRRLLRFPRQESRAAPGPPPPKSGRSYLAYIHIPFCEELCPYCTFNRVKLDTSLASRYFPALREEMRLYGDMGYSFDALYIGGGTPTILPEELASVVREARRLWPIQSLSVETNPNHLTDRTLKLLAHLGVDRLSVGVQSFDDGLLRHLKRYERYGSGEEIRERLACVQGRFRTLNVDMIFNFALQTEAMLERDLAILLGLQADQVTFYPLMGPRAERGPYRKEKRFYARIREAMAAGYAPSTAWCFSRREARSAGPPRLIDEYIVAREEFAGLGAGSFGYLNGELYADDFSLPRYADRLARGLLPVRLARRFSPAERLRYDFLMRLFAGSLEVDWLERGYGSGALRRLVKEVLFFRMAGALRMEDGKLVLTGKGYYFWVILMREFFRGVNQLREGCLHEECAR